MYRIVIMEIRKIIILWFKNCYNGDMSVGIESLVEGELFRIFVGLIICFIILGL